MSSSWQRTRLQLDTFLLHQPEALPGNASTARAGATSSSKGTGCITARRGRIGRSGGSQERELVRQSRFAHPRCALRLRTGGQEWARVCCGPSSDSPCTGDGAWRRCSLRHTAALRQPVTTWRTSWGGCRSTPRPGHGLRRLFCLQALRAFKSQACAGDGKRRRVADVRPLSR